jgi:hypothetical protein
MGTALVWYLVASVGAITLGAVLISRIKSDVGDDEFRIVVLGLCVSHVFGALAWIVKGFSILSFLVFLCFAYIVLFVASWGHPGEFLVVMRTGGFSRRAWLLTLRLTAAALVAAFTLVLLLPDLV